MVVLLNFQLRTGVFAFFGCFIFSHLFGAVSAVISEKCLPGSLLDAQNRDDVKPEFPLQEDPRIKSYNIEKAHDIIRNGLQQFLDFKEADLETYLNHIIASETITFKDEYGQEIRAYYKVFQFILVQYREMLCQNYAIKQYDKDKLDLCSIARFLSHQAAVYNRESIMRRVGDALGDKCHPCTPYKRKEYGETVISSTLSLIEGEYPEQILSLCKDYDHHGHKVVVSPAPIITNTKAPEMNEADKPTYLSFDYTPCNYSNGDVVCDKVPIEEVQKVFRRTSFPRLAAVKLTLQPYIFTETFIPEDIFGTKRILDILIEFPHGSVMSPSLRLQVDGNAFQASKVYTNKFTIAYIDCTLLDLGFLSGFNKLIELTLSNIYEIHQCLSSLPPLPSLTKLNFFFCSKMQDIFTFPTLANGLKVFGFQKNDKNLIYSNMELNDETVDRLMDWLLLSSSNTMEEMIITFMGQVTKVPNKIAAFKALKKLGLYDNNISSIKAGAFFFSVPVSFLSISGNGIKGIEPGTFKGDFQDAVVNVHNNELTRFEEPVFGYILQQMASGRGFINANGNEIDCSFESICHLAWLMRYEAGSDFHLNCSNGTSFQDLQSAGFNHCQREYIGVAVSNTDEINPIENSSFDYTPCSISNGDVVCNEVLLEEVQKVFKRTSLPTLTSVKLTLQPYIFSETFVPEDVFGSKRILEIKIEYPFRATVNRSLILQVDADAFRSTKSYTTNFTINIIDCTLLDLGFLSGFEKLAKLEFYNVHNIQECLPSIPPLPRLTALYIGYCTGIHQLSVFPSLTNGLKIFNFYGDVNNDLKSYGDVTVDRIMDSLLLSSANTLEEMTIENMNQVTRIPHKIASFKVLTKLWIHKNNIPIIRSGELSFSVPVTSLNIGSNGIREIETGAFQGNFKDATVYVYNNQLTRFEESVFGPMLQQMASGKGLISAREENGNPIDCSTEECLCHLAWLRRYKAGSDFYLKCSNGTKFEDLIF